MTDPTLKQVRYAKQLGIAEPENKTKEELSKMIDEKVSSKREQKAKGNQVDSVHNSVQISRVEKPHSFEFGKATNRFKLYYGTVDELKSHIEELTKAGMIDNKPEITEEQV